MDITTVIIVRGGRVTEVYSTLPSVNHDVEVLDLDVAKQESTEAETEKRIEEVIDSEKYFLAY